jgi:hypothetical protein
MIYKVKYKDVVHNEHSIFCHANSLDDLGKQIIDYHAVVDHLNKEEASIHFNELSYIKEGLYEYDIDVSLNHLFKDDVGSLTLANQYHGTVELVKEI